MFKVVFRLDWGKTIGSGHYIRCLSLADAFQKSNKAEIQFITRSSLPENIVFPVKKLEKALDIVDGTGYEYLSIEDEIDEMKAFLKSNTIDCLIVDSYGVTETYFSELRPYVKIMTYVDDLFCKKYDVDVIVNGNAYATEAFYEKEGKEKFLLLGCEYTLLRDEFSNLSKRAIKDTVQVVTISSGGSDPMDFTLVMIGLVKKYLVPSIQKKIVIGPYFTNVERIKKAVEGDNSFQLLFQPSMKEVMLNTDLFLTSSGSILYELAATGTPSISFLLSYDQSMLGQYMSEKGTTIQMGKLENFQEQEAGSSLKMVIADKNLRRQLSEAGQRILDGNGARRVAEKILAYMEVHL
ncbi:UDP-2,4-diacetamido-2,4,6-trideoxy-beta-L-altropyranose hydrolase [Anaeromicropila populeti]|uniref:UDP-2,4-diacetamido-2,4,6-trideoxy-beta-L-altropyranose hydrolase n=1 Tax=Anaeromicropila populeti TaxID=37658 RepID=A0A1I6HVS0_9FIRM|nr:UDP-2,4-diacetamido-2,4,6-trideoxy-beta-L-altropyranose hydrolase [Anaeromicropila populeti]SFR58562.1 UDP-2,4-diacetamido-2,4,6-trideoxy-beta-L-altropyranose hydrolase [Anaeromicropila populeti]